MIEISDKESEKGYQIYQKIIASKDDVAITSITMYEALYGLMKYSKPFDHLFSFHVYEFSSEDAKQAAQLELGLERMGKKIKRTDINSASTTINKGATLCTFDNEFEALEDFGLRIM